MEIGLVVIVLLIATVIIAIVAIAGNDKNATFGLGVIFGLILSILVSIEVVLLSSILEKPNPTAIDVYQDKTTLEFTIRDNVKIDSIVVFKDSLIIN